jgi:hypothetical protein
MINTKWNTLIPIVFLMLLSWQPTVQADLNDGLMAYYPFEGKYIEGPFIPKISFLTWYRANDASGNGNHATVRGATLTEDRFGNVDSAYSFNGVNNYIERPFDYDFTPSTQSWTVAAWIKSGNGPIVSWYRCGANRSCTGVDSAFYELHIYPNSQIIYNLGDDSNRRLRVVSPATLTNDWHFVVGMLDRTTNMLKLYVDGIEVNSIPSNLGSLSDGNINIPLSIGRFFRTGWGSPHYYRGVIDDVRIYNRVLTESEIQTLYNQQFLSAGTDMTIELGDTVNLNGSFEGLVSNAPYSYVWKLGDGNTVTGTLTKGGDIAVTHIYNQEGEFNTTLEVTDSKGNTYSEPMTVHVVNSIAGDPCDIPTIRSQSPWGLWNNPNTWNTGTVPSQNDLVLIQGGHNVLLPKSNQTISVKGLCIANNGTLRSYFNTATSPPVNIRLSAATLNNQGTILGSFGVNGTVINESYKHATNGSSIKIYANHFINTGKILANGRGGDDLPFNYFKKWSSIEARGGQGGSVEIYPVIFENNGIIQSGDGGIGDAFQDWEHFVYGNAIGGSGGLVRIFATNLAMSSNGPGGQIKGGSGGYADGIANWFRSVTVNGDYWFHFGGFLNHVNGGRGGPVTANLGNMSGIVSGHNGSTAKRTYVLPTIWIWYDPTTMTVDETTRFQNSENIVLFGGDDWVMDLRKLSPGAVHAIKNVIIAVGNGSVVDLRGVQDKVFVAGEKIDIYADEILLDAGVSIEDLVEAPEVNVSGSKILYHVELSYDKHIVDEPNTTVLVKTDVLNNGPTQDTYTVEITDEQGWAISQLPQQVTVNGLRRTELRFEVTLPAKRGAENTLTVTVTSQNDATVQAVANIRLGVKEKETIESRNHKKADLTVVMDNTFVNAGISLMIADALETALMEQSQQESSISDEQVIDFLEQFDENNPPTQEDLQAFLNQSETEEAVYEPVVELITITNQAVSRVVSENLAEVIGKLRSLPPDIQRNCATATVSGLQAALSKMNIDGQIILVTAEMPNANVTRMITKLQEKGVKVHVILTGTCGEGDKSIYTNLAAQTGGTLTELTRGITTELALQETLSDVMTHAIDEVSKIVMFEYFIATATPDGNRLEFKTLIETGNAGFNLWRSEKNEAGEFINIVKLNAELISPQEQALYHLIDDNAAPNQAYYYAIEDVNIDGVSQLHEDLIAVVKPDSLLAPAACLIYGIHDQGVNNSIAFTIEPETQEVMPLGNLHKGKDIEAMAIHPKTGMIYLASGNDTKSHPKGHVYKMDAQTSEFVSVGHTGFEEISDMVFNRDGTKLWGWAKNQGVITINPTTGAGSLEIPSDILVEGFTLAEGYFYGSVNTQLWKYEVETETLEITCSNLPGETESLTAIDDGLLLIGLHNKPELKVFDPNSCQVVDSISSGKFDDVEGLAMPTAACQ